MAESNSVRYALFLATTVPKSRTNRTTASYGTLTQRPPSPAVPTRGAGSGRSRAPPKARGLDRRVPQLGELVVQLEQRDGVPGHLERGDVRADQVPLDLDAPAV